MRIAVEEMKKRTLEEIETVCKMGALVEDFAKKEYGELEDEVIFINYRGTGKNEYWFVDGGNEFFVKENGEIKYLPTAKIIEGFFID